MAIAEARRRAAADPVPRRTASGVLVTPGHVGTIYAATNAVYAGRATARTVKLLPDGTVFHSGVRAGSAGALTARKPASQQSMRVPCTLDRKCEISAVTRKICESSQSCQILKVAC
jgi:hypothetical protein